MALSQTCTPWLSSSLVMAGILKDLKDQEFAPEHLRAFLEWLSSDSENRETAYESARRRLVIFFGGRKCVDPETLTDQTLDCAIRKLSEIPTEARPMAYLIGIAKNIYRDELRAAQKFEAFRSSQIILANSRQSSSLTTQSNLNELESRHSCLEKCLGELPAEDRAMVLGYYSESKQTKIDNRKQLADRSGLNLNALRNRIFRLNQRLALCVTSCLENVPA